MMISGYRPKLRSFDKLSLYIGIDVLSIEFIGDDLYAVFECLCFADGLPDGFQDLGVVVLDGQFVLHILEDLVAEAVECAD